MITYPVGLIRSISTPSGLIASNFSTVLTNFTNNGAPLVTDRNGVPNQAFGVDSTNDPNLNSSNLGIIGSGARTFCFWVFRSSLSGPFQIIHGGVTFEFRAIQLRIIYGASTINVPYTISNDTWFFYVIKLNGTQLGDFEVKENDLLLTTPSDTTIINSSDTPISIATYPYNNPYNNAHDNIYIFDRLTTDEEDTNLFNY